MTQSIRDIVLSQASILPSFEIEVEETAELFGQKLTVKNQTVCDVEFLQYPYLFGESSPLARVWFKKSEEAKVTNQFLFVLEQKLSGSNFYENLSLINEAFAPSEIEIFISRVKYPINLVPYPLDGHPAAVRCG